MVINPLIEELVPEMSSKVLYRLKVCFRVDYNWIKVTLLVRYFLLVVLPRYWFCTGNWGRHRISNSIVNRILSILLE